MEVEWKNTVRWDEEPVMMIFGRCFAAFDLLEFGTPFVGLLLWMK